MSYLWADQRGSSGAERVEGIFSVYRTGEAEVRKMIVMSLCYL